MLLKAFLVVLFSCTTYLLLYIRLGYNLHYKKHHPGQCRQVEGVEFGSEDLQVTNEGLAFISAGVLYEAMSPQFKEFIAQNRITGSIMMLDLKHPEQGAIELSIEPSQQLNLRKFRPHGLSLVEDKVKAEHLIYVINHQGLGQDRVEKFRFQPQTRVLVHLRSFTSDLFRVTNDLAVLREDQFFISNFLFSKTFTMAILEHLSPVGMGSLIYFNGSNFETVASGLFGPNGITLSHDNRFLYVASPLSDTMDVYQILDGKRLRLVQSVMLYTSPDNFHLSTSGNELYVGCHPIPYKTLDHLNQPEHTSPSSVLRVPLKNGLVIEDKITEVFYDHGDLISGSSVATVYGDQLLIGSVMNELVLCDLVDKKASCDRRATMASSIM